ncbi:MAG: hypothetical protein ACO1O6_14895 [Bacteroidota bacterium]
MTEKEALALFGLEADADTGALQDALDEHLFELKRFFTTRAPIEKLFRSRLDKLRKYSAALQILNPEYECADDAEKEEPGFVSEDILDVFQAYQQQNRKLKTGITQSSDPAEIHLLTEALIRLEKSYASLWAIEGISEDQLLVSKESDPMEILAAIKAFRGKGGNSFDDLKKSENTAPEALQNEMKRLSLLFFKY